MSVRFGWLLLSVCGLAIGACAGADEIELDVNGMDETEFGPAPGAELGQHQQAMMDDGSGPNCSTCVGAECVGCLEQWTHGGGSGGPYDPPGGGGYLPGDVGTTPSSSGSCIAPACKSSCMSEQRRCRAACGADLACKRECGTTAECIDICCG